MPDASGTAGASLCSWSSMLWRSSTVEAEPSVTTSTEISPPPRKWWSALNRLSPVALIRCPSSSSRPYSCNASRYRLTVGVTSMVSVSMGWLLVICALLVWPSFGSRDELGPGHCDADGQAPGTLLHRELRRLLQQVLGAGEVVLVRRQDDGPEPEGLHLLVPVAEGV